MKRVLMTVGLAMAFSSSAIAEDDFDNNIIESACAYVKAGKSRYELRTTSSIMFLRMIKGKVNNTNAFAIKLTAIALKGAEKELGCPEMNNAELYKAINVPTFFSEFEGIPKIYLKAISMMYKSVKEKNYDCKKVSGFVSVPNIYVLACDQDNRFYKMNANYPIVEFCGNSLNDRCFR